MEQSQFIVQRALRLPEKIRGLHLITSEIVGALPEIGKTKTGMLYVFLKHTSAGLCINENADPDVRHDLEVFLDKLIPEGEPYFRHNAEGPDDMPAHIKSVLTGVSLQIPVLNGGLNLGTWQGIYLCEYRNRGGKRNLVLSLYGSSF